MGEKSPLEENRAFLLIHSGICHTVHLLWPMWASWHEDVVSRRQCFTSSTGTWYSWSWTSSCSTTSDMVHTGLGQWKTPQRHLPSLSATAWSMGRIAPFGFACLGPPVQLLNLELPEVLLPTPKSNFLRVCCQSALFAGKFTGEGRERERENKDEWMGYATLADQLSFF